MNVEIDEKVLITIRDIIRWKDTKPFILTTVFDVAPS